MTLDYHNDTTHLTKSQLATFLKSPVEYYHTFVTGKMRKKRPKTTMIGSVCHAVLLEGRALQDVFIAYPDSCLKSDGSINPKPAAQFRYDNTGKEVGKNKDEWQILSLIAAVRESKLAALIDAADEREQTKIGSYKGRPIKCRPDFYSPGIIYDLKFSEDISDAMIWSNFKRFKYWLQDAHYTACFEEKPAFRFWVCETQFPYRIKTRTFNPIAREMATDKWRRTMDRFIEAESTGVWEDETDAVYGLSEWDIGAEDEELVSYEGDADDLYE